MDNYKTPLGELGVTVLGHASIILEWNGKFIYVDPYSVAADFTGMPFADLILITHNHFDHYDKKAYSLIEKKDTIFVVSDNVGRVNDRYHVLKNGESFTYENEVRIDAVASYNVNNRNKDGNLFHPKGVGNGYVVDFNGFRLYIAGDTEPIPEMRSLSSIDIAFLPKMIPFTMSDEEFIKVANSIHPTCLYPIHYYEIDWAKLIRNLDAGIKIIDTNKKQWYRN